MSKQKEMRKIFNKQDTFSKVFSAGFLGLSIYSGIKEGNGVIKSTVKGLGEFALQEAITGLIGGPASMALAFAPMIADGMTAMSKVGREKAQHNMLALSTGRIGGKINDNEYAATMRQRQIQSMGGNLAQTRQLFGSEARRRSININY